MSPRRWTRDEPDPENLGPGPVERAVAEELEALGYTPLTPPGVLRTAATRALALAETFDATMNSATLPALDRQLATAMGDCRAAVDRAAGGLEDGEDPERDEEVDDFTKRRQRRADGTDG